MKYQHYPTAIKLHYAAGTLPKEYFKNIPAFTKYYWKDILSKGFWKSESDLLNDYDNIPMLKLELQNKRLKQLLRLLLCLLNVHIQLLKRFSITHTDFIAVRFAVAYCVQYAKRVNYNVFKNRMPFSYKQFCTWVSARNCISSPLLLC